MALHFGDVRALHQQADLGAFDAHPAVGLPAGENLPNLPWVLLPRASSMQRTTLGLGSWAVVGALFFRTDTSEVARRAALREGHTLPAASLTVAETM